MILNKPHPSRETVPLRKINKKESLVTNLSVDGGEGVVVVWQVPGAAAVGVAPADQLLHAVHGVAPALLRLGLSRK